MIWKHYTTTMFTFDSLNAWYRNIIWPRCLLLTFRPRGIETLYDHGPYCWQSDRVVQTHYATTVFTVDSHTTWYKTLCTQKQKHYTDTVPETIMLHTIYLYQHLCIDYKHFNYRISATEMLAKTFKISRKLFIFLIS